MTAVLSPLSPKSKGGGFVDLVAVARFAKGDALSLTDDERAAAIHLMRQQGRSIDHIAKRLRTREDNVKATLAAPSPVDLTDPHLIKF